MRDERLDLRLLDSLRAAHRRFRHIYLLLREPARIPNVIWSSLPPHYVFGVGSK